MHDGSFEGLMTAIAVALREGDRVEGLLRADDPPTLLPVEPVRTRPDILDRMGDYLARRAGPETPEVLYHAYLSLWPDLDTPMLRYVRLGLSMGRDPGPLRQNPDVLRVKQAQRKLLGEMHLFLGILRFRQAGPSLFVADCEPDGRILPLLGDHFADRLWDQPFVIRDLRHGEAVLYRPGADWRLVALPDEKRAPLESADPMEALWRRYFEVLAIPERRNPLVQRTHLPKKRWRHLVERPGAGPDPNQQ